MVMIVFQGKETRILALEYQANDKRVMPVLGPFLTKSAQYEEQQSPWEGQDVVDEWVRMLSSVV